MHPFIDYYHIPELIEAQRNFIVSRIARTVLSATIIYPPPPPQSTEFNTSQQQWTDDIIGNAVATSGLAVSRNNAIAAKALMIPGVMEAVWTLSDLIQSTNRTAEYMN